MSLAERDALVALLDTAPSPVDLVDVLSRRFVPPELRTTDDQPLAPHAAVLRTSDPTALAARLDAITDDGPGPADGPADSLSRSWTIADPDGPVRASVELTGTTVEVQALSDDRFEAVLAELRAADGALEVLEHDRRTAAEMTELAERFPGLSTPPPTRWPPCRPSTAPRCWTLSPRSSA